MAEELARIYSCEVDALITVEKVHKTPEEWRQVLTPEQYAVARGEGTEPAFQNAYWDNHAAGIYRCVCCDTDLFRSDAKFDSGTGWPSFYQPISPENITTHTDTRLFTERTEVRCRRCGAHLGHVFDDGPPLTGLRFCMNSASLRFVPGACSK